MLFRLLLCLGLLSLLACVGPQSSSVKSLQAKPDQNVVSIYMAASGVAELDVVIRLEGVAIEVEGAWIDLTIEPVELNFLQLKKQQQLVAVAIAPAGKHRRVRLRFTEPVPNGAAEQGKKIADLSLREPLVLESGDSKCLFVDWQFVSAQPGGKERTSRFAAWGQKLVLGGELLYVASNGINTIYVARMDTNEVVAAFAVPGELADIRMLNDQRRLYVLCKGRRSLYVYDCLNDRLIDQIALTGSIAPENLLLSPDGRFAYVSDETAASVFQVELASGQIVTARRIGHRPQRMAFIDDGQGRLAVAAPSSNQVFILSANGLQIERIIPVGSRPAGLLYFANYLYVAESGSQSVALFDYQSGKQIAKISVGAQPDSLLNVDQHNAYVSNSAEQSLTALSAGQNMAFRRIATPNSPTRMAYSPRKRLLYVLNSKQGRVTVIDRDSEQQLRQLVFGGKPKSLAILE